MMIVQDFYATTEDIPQPKLALDCLGGRVGTDMIRSLGNGIYTYIPVPIF